MTVRDLINELEHFNDDMEVVIKPSNSMYVDGISGTNTRKLRSFYGEDREVLVVTSDGQVGAI